MSAKDSSVIVFPEITSGSANEGAGVPKATGLDSVRGINDRVTRLGGFAGLANTRVLKEDMQR